MPKHSDVSLGARHPVHDLEFADATARGGFAAVVADVGRVCLQLDTLQFYILSDNSPLTWEQISPEPHALGAHTADTLANLNAIISDATLIDTGDSRLSDNRTDADAIHDNVSGEISAIAEKVTPVSGDLLLIEDSAASNAKKKIQIGNLPSGGGAADDENAVIAGQVFS